MQIDWRHRAARVAVRVAVRALAWLRMVVAARPWVHTVPAWALARPRQCVGIR